MGSPNKKKCQSCKMTTKPCACGRPSKLVRFTKALEKVLKEDMVPIICTDEDLVFLVNEKLPEEDRIHEKTFSRWKNGETEDERCQPFHSLYKKALIQQKQNLFTKLSEEGTWQKWAWIIERKFDEWNLKRKQEAPHKEVMGIEGLIARAKEYRERKKKEEEAKANKEEIDDN